jgi:hypothetical protein
VTQLNPESTANFWPLVQIAFATLAAFTSAATLMWLLTLVVSIP